MDQKGPKTFHLCQFLGPFKAILPRMTGMSTLLWKQFSLSSRVANMGYVKVKFDDCSLPPIECGLHDSITVLRLSTRALAKHQQLLPAWTRLRKKREGEHRAGGEMDRRMVPKSQRTKSPGVLGGSKAEEVGYLRKSSVMREGI
jgi:hypothetical protein